MQLMNDTRLIFGESLHRLMHAYQRAMREGFRAHDIDLTVAQVRVLKCVAAADAPTVQGVAARMDSDRGQVTRAVAQLRERALVTQRDNTADRRMPLLAITSSGQARLVRVIDIQAAAGRRMAGGLTDADVARFVAIADQMTDALHSDDGAVVDG